MTALRVATSTIKTEGYSKSICRREYLKRTSQDLQKLPHMSITFDVGMAERLRECQ